jgi:hypothetical protein
MNRKEMIQVFLGLVQAVQQGVVTDVLWMGGSQDTIFDFFLGTLGIDEEAAQDLDYLEELLLNELDTKGGMK